MRPPPLIAATAAGHAETVRLLLEHGADVGVRDGEGRTAADIAREEGLVDVLAELAKVRHDCEECKMEATWRRDVGRGGELKYF